MAVQVMVHIVNEEPFLADIEDLPDPTTNYVYLTNPRTREGKRLTWTSQGAVGFIYPLTRIAFLEVLVKEDPSLIEPFFRDKPVG